MASINLIYFGVSIQVINNVKSQAFRQGLGGNWKIMAGSEANNKCLNADTSRSEARGVGDCGTRGCSRG